MSFFRKYLCGLLGLAVVYSLLNGVLGDRGTDMAAVSGDDLAPARLLTSRYDTYFRKYTRTYFGRVPWQWFKAQAIQESMLEPRARSSVGAMGLMQIMPATFKEIRGEIGIGPNPWDPKTNIEAGIYYDYRCFETWSERRSTREKLLLMFASYNAGPGNIVRAQRVVRDRGICGGRTWDCIQNGLPHVTGRHSAETISYVDRIQKYHDML